MDPHEPRCARADVPAPASVSPVGSKKKVKKLDVGRNCAFSGRLKGVAPLLLAKAFDEKESNPSTSVSRIVTQSTGYDVPGAWSLSWAWENTSATASLAWNTSGVPSIETLSACSLPPEERFVGSWERSGTRTNSAVLLLWDWSGHWDPHLQKYLPRPQ